MSGWPSGLRRQFKALVFGRGSHFGQIYFFPPESVVYFKTFAADGQAKSEFDAHFGQIYFFPPESVVYFKTFAADGQAKSEFNDLCYINKHIGQEKTGASSLRSFARPQLLHNH
jgi:hypothetical protein